MSDSAPDRALLTDYVANGSQAAFAELVRRHIDMVWSTARRSVGDSHLAQDISQAVFLLLARKAVSLQSQVNLSGWLYNTTRHVSRNAIRARRRKDFHESEAGDAMPTITRHESQVDAEELHDAIARLPGADRSAIVLRFFEQLSLREVGVAIGVSEDAAKVRVARAVAKLRRLMGGTAAAIAIVEMLSGSASEAAPASLAKSINLAVFANAASAPVLELAKGAILAMKYAQLKVAALVIAASVAIASAAVGVVMMSGSSSPGDQSPQTVARLEDDRSTPSRAMQTLMREMLAGADEGQGWIADTEAERDAGEMISEMYFASGKLLEAVNAKFAESIPIDRPLQLPSPDQLEGASEVYPQGQSDIAYVIDKAGRSLLPMRKDGDEWKLAVADLAFNLKLEPEAMTRRCRERMELFKELSERVRADEFESVEQVQQAMKQ